MRRTTEPQKTSVTSVAFALALAAFVLWMTSFATRSEGLFNQGERSTLASGGGADANSNRASAS